MNLASSVYLLALKAAFWLGKNGTRYHAIQQLFERQIFSSVLRCDNMSGPLTISYNGPDVAAAGRQKASKLCLFAYYRNCDHTYVICMHGS